LDGPLGTELLRRGVPTPTPGWSAHALETSPEAVAAIHRDYAASGATLHTTNTFRTQPNVFPSTWEALARDAALLARRSIGPDHKLLGSIAPLADCYRPDQSPAHSDPRGTKERHGQLARVLAQAGCDVLLCETFPLVRESLLALEAALETGLETWISWTPGYDGSLLTATEIASAARSARDLGARACLVNCAAASQMSGYLAPLVESVGGDVRVGCYANAGKPEEEMGWQRSRSAPARYAETARTWLDLGATIIGGCCGTGPEHVRALRALIDQREA